METLVESPEGVPGPFWFADFYFPLVSRVEHYFYLSPEKHVNVIRLNRDRALLSSVANDVVSIYIKRLPPS
jgi:hypothetical protein